MGPADLGLHEVEEQAHDQSAARLIRMAEQISLNTVPGEGHLAAVVDQIKRFWTRQMREDFIAAVDASAPTAELAEIVNAIR
jgi:c-di-AMP phosphodiesterase-like protein